MVAANWDTQLLRGLSKYPEVEWIYAKLAQDKIGGGRGSFVLPKLTKVKAQSYIKSAQAQGLKFNYLLNASCLGNHEYNKEMRYELLSELDWVVSAGADGVTISTDFLFNVARKKYPKLKIGIGVFKGVNSLETLKYYQDKGADWVTLPFFVVRDFKFMEQIPKKIKMDVHLFVNNICLYVCPHIMTQPNTLSHSSQVGGLGCESCVDFYLLKCNKIKMDRPEELLKSCWIRPEDIKIYEEMGFKYFKISDRSRSTEWLLNVVHAYTQQKYKGDLAQIMSLEIPGDEQQLHPQVNTEFRKKLLQHNNEDQMLLRSMSAWGHKGRPKIDNRKLDFFLKFFQQNNCRLSDCEQCGYCKAMAKKAVVFEDKYASRMLSQCLGKSARKFIRNEFFKKPDMKVKK